MKKYRNYSRFEDFKRIKGGYKPRMYFISLYSIYKLFIISKMFVYRACENFIAGFLIFGKKDKKIHMLPFRDYDHKQ